MDNFVDTLFARFIQGMKLAAPVIKRSAELGVMIFGCYMSAKGLEWSMNYADVALTEPNPSQTNTSLVIAAILGPLLTFTGAIVKMYLMHSNGNGNGNGNGSTDTK